jgi:hypothetical protein
MDPVMVSSLKYCRIELVYCIRKFCRVGNECNFYNIESTVGAKKIARSEKYDAILAKAIEKLL